MVTVVLAVIVVVLLGVIGFLVHEDQVRESYEKGVMAGDERASENILTELRAQGYATRSFMTDNGTVEANLIIQPTKSQVDSIYLQGLADGRKALATDMFGKLVNQGFVEYNFTYQGKIYPVKLVPEAGSAQAIP